MKFRDLSMFPSGLAKENAACFLPSLQQEFKGVSNSARQQRGRASGFQIKMSKQTSTGKSAWSMSIENDHLSWKTIWDLYLNLPNKFIDFHGENLKVATVQVSLCSNDTEKDCCSFFLRPEMKKSRNSPILLKVV